MSLSAALLNQGVSQNAINNRAKASATGTKSIVNNTRDLSGERIAHDADNSTIGKQFSGDIISDIIICTDPTCCPGTLKTKDQKAATKQEEANQSQSKQLPTAKAHAQQPQAKASDPKQPPEKDNAKPPEKPAEQQAKAPNEQPAKAQEPTHPQAKAPNEQPAKAQEPTHPQAKAPAENPKAQPAIQQAKEVLAKALNQIAKIFPELSKPVQQSLVQLLAKLPEGLQKPLITLLAQLPKTVQATLIKLLDPLPPKTQQSLVQLLAKLPEGLQKPLITLLAQLSPSKSIQVITLLDKLFPMLSDLQSEELLNLLKKLLKHSDAIDWLEELLHALENDESYTGSLEELLDELKKDKQSSDSESNKNPDENPETDSELDDESDDKKKTNISL